MSKWIIEYFDERAGVWAAYDCKELFIEKYETAWNFIKSVTSTRAELPKFRAVNVETQQGIDGELVTQPAKVYSH